MEFLLGTKDLDDSTSREAVKVITKKPTGARKVEWVVREFAILPGGTKTLRSTDIVGSREAAFQALGIEDPTLELGR